MKNKYYINPDTDELIIATESSSGEYSIIELPIIAELEFEDQEEECEEESDDEEPVSHKKIRINWKTQRKVKELLDEGKNSREIALALNRSIEDANQIIMQVRGADMDSKVNDHEGVSL